ncbi:MAG: amino acid ABC transporter ATP-binding protein [Arsenophonus sp.]|nr:MAG: amino acid ABC transporter ATP-binding protein [Arsenophonus sp.]
MIHIKNISKWYNKFQVLNDCSIHLKKGEIIVICGPSGSGKSTLIKTVNGLENIQKGEIYINDISIHDKKTNLTKIRSMVGMVLQNSELFPHLSIIDNLILGPMKVLKKNKISAKKMATELLNRVGLINQIYKFPSQLSGGQKQRIAIVRALCMQPHVMLFDEPTSALDPEMIKKILDMIEELAKQGMTMIIVTHEMNFAKKIADRIIFMDKGKILEDTNKKDFFISPKTKKAKKFLLKIIY